MLTSLIINKAKIKVFSIFFLSLLCFSCTNIRNQYDGVWKIESASDVQNLIDMGLTIKLVVNTKAKYMQIWTYIDGEGTLQNTGTLYYFNGDSFPFRLPDLEPEHNGANVYGKLTLLDNKLHYSTGLRNDWTFVKEE